MLPSFAYAFFIVTSQKAVTELHDAEFEKRRQKGSFKSFNDNPPEYPKFNSWRTRTIEMNKLLEFVPKIFEYIDTVNPLLSEKCQSKKSANVIPIVFQTSYELKSTISDPKNICTSINLQRSNSAEKSPQTFTKTNCHP